MPAAALACWAVAVDGPLRPAALLGEVVGLMSAATYAVFTRRLPAAARSPRFWAAGIAGVLAGLLLALAAALAAMFGAAAYHGGIGAAGVEVVGVFVLACAILGPLPGLFGAFAHRWWNRRSASSGPASP